MDSKPQNLQDLDLTTVSSTPVKNRNVDVLGKTGAGKSTIANKILQGQGDDQSNKFEVSYSVISSESRGNMAPTALLDTTNRKFIMQVVDTWGLFDTIDKKCLMTRL